MLYHRVFITINLPENIKEKLIFYQKKWPEIPAKWVKENNLHITLDFIGNTSTQELPEIFDILEKVSKEINSFSINLFKICYGPENLKNNKPPRMIWAVGDEPEELAKLKKSLNKHLNIKEDKQFIPHITLARIKQWEISKIDPEEIPIIEEDISLNFTVDSIDIMESKLKRKGPEYTILKTYNLTK